MKYNIKIKSVQEAKTQKPSEYMISICDEKHPHRAFGWKSTLDLTFYDVWEGQSKLLFTWNHNNPIERGFSEKDLPNKYILDKVDNFLDTITDEENIDLTIHCWAGISRSSSIALYILLTRENKSIEEALHYILSLRPQANPNKQVVKLIDERLNLNGKLIETVKKYFG